jgi:hypothetical protein
MTSFNEKTFWAWWCSVWLVILLTIFACGVFDKVTTPTIENEPQLYTVYCDGVEHKDLEIVSGGMSWARYKTLSGKRIEFHGTFYDLEQ